MFSHFQWLARLGRGGGGGGGGGGAVYWGNRIEYNNSLFKHGKIQT